MPTKINEGKSEQPKSAAVMRAVLEENPTMAQSLADEGVIGYSNGAVTFSENTATIRAIGDSVMKYQTTRDMWLNTLVNRIVYTIVTSRMWEFKYARFEKGMLELGETVEELFVNLIEPYKFSNDYAEKKVHSRFRNDVRAAFHARNITVQYPLSVSQMQMRTAFLSWQNLDDFISKQIEALWTSLNTDKFNLFKYTLGRAMLDGFIGGVKIPDVSNGDAESLNDAIAAMRELSLNLEYNTPNYNAAGVYNHTEITRQTFIMTSRFDAQSAVKVLARAYNMDEATLLAKSIGIDSFANVDWARLKLMATDPDTKVVEDWYKPYTAEEVRLLEKIPAVVCDDDIWQIWTNLLEMSDQPNRMGLWWNYWLTYFATFSMSPFANAAALCSETGSVTSVTVSPAEATLSKGASLQLEAAVATTGVVTHAVDWEMTGNESASYVDGNGRVFIAKDETATSITVKATSVADAKKSGSATITVSE